MALESIRNRLSRDLNQAKTSTISIILDFGREEVSSYGNSNFNAIPQDPASIVLEEPSVSQSDHVWICLLRGTHMGADMKIYAAGQHRLADLISDKLSLFEWCKAFDLCPHRMPRMSKVRAANRTRFGCSRPVAP